MTVLDVAFQAGPIGNLLINWEVIDELLGMTRAADKDSRRLVRE